MDLLKTPSLQSLVDSDIVSIESLQCLDIEELDVEEYALPPPEEPPSLATLLAECEKGETRLHPATTAVPSAALLHAELLQGVSKQLNAAEERSGAGAATALAAAPGRLLAVGTAHGHVLTFRTQALRWVCSVHAEHGAVAALAFDETGVRLLVGFARGLVAQYECARGTVLRRVTPGGGGWGVLRVGWAGGAGLSLDTGGSVWLLRFSRPLGVRTARASCLFSGARGEVVALAARDARTLALATLSRVIAVCSGRAAAASLTGPPNSPPLIAWTQGAATSDSVLISARGTLVQWHSVSSRDGAAALRPLRRARLDSSLLWLGWLEDRLAYIDFSEKLRLWDNEEDSSLDLSWAKLVYASAFFKGVWTEGRVSGALAAAGVGVLGGTSSSDGALVLLGRAGVVRVRSRSSATRARALAAAGHWARALRLALNAKDAALELLDQLAANMQAMADVEVAESAVKLCIKFRLVDKLWVSLWENGTTVKEFIEAIGSAAGNSQFHGDMVPPPAAAQRLVSAMVECADPTVLERVLVALPLACLDPHQAVTVARSLRLWRALVSLSAKMGGLGTPFRDLAGDVKSCRAGTGGEGACECPGDALLLHAADGLAGRSASGALPPHAQPALRHEMLGVLVGGGAGGPSGGEGAPPVLSTLVSHDVRSLLSLLSMAFSEPPFVGPLGRQNRLRMARSLIACLDLELHEDDSAEILYFLASELSTAALPADRALLEAVRARVVAGEFRRHDDAWLCLLRARSTSGDLSTQLQAATQRPRVRRRLLELLARKDEALEAYLDAATHDKEETEELFRYLGRRAAEEHPEIEAVLRRRLGDVVQVRPKAAARLLSARWPALVTDAAATLHGEDALLFTTELNELGSLKGATAISHLRLLCQLRPGEVVDFVKALPSHVPHEIALKIVRENGVDSAVPVCLELAGDAIGALRAALHYINKEQDEGRRASLAAEAGETCARLARAATPDAAAELWKCFTESDEVLRHAPVAALLEGARYVPLTMLVARACSGPDARYALAMLLAGAADQAMATRATARVLSGELHDALAEKVRRTGRALAVRSWLCAVCAQALHLQTSRAYSCGHALHLSCAAGAPCARCGRRADGERRLSTHFSKKPPPAIFTLQLTAPPRPDLQGLV